jgi:hypothetical protein
MNDDIKSEINALAEKLVSLDGDTQPEETDAIRNRIYALFFEAKFKFKKTDKYGNDLCTFPLLDGLEATLETVLNTLDENLRKSKRTGEWNFKPQNGDFILTIIKKTKFKIGRGDKGLKGYIPERADVDSESKHTTDIKEYADLTDDFAKLETKHVVQQAFMYIAELIIRQRRIERGNVNKQHFDGFFTHDTVTETRKTNGEYITDECCNSAIFPAMCVKMLSYLMTGEFAHMRDLMTNELRPGINLARRVENVGACYGMKSPKYYHGQYNEWRKSVAKALKEDFLLDI